MPQSIKAYSNLTEIISHPKTLMLLLSFTYTVPILKRKSQSPLGWRKDFENLRVLVQQPTAQAGPPIQTNKQTTRRISFPRVKFIYSVTKQLVDILIIDESTSILKISQYIFSH